MKKIAVIILSLITSALWAQEACHNYDYQELKDMSAEQLGAEFCKVQGRLEENANSETFYSERVKGSLNLARLSSEMGNRRDAQKYRDSAVRYADVGEKYKREKDACADQQERVLRVLAQKTQQSPEGSVPVCPSKD